MAERPRLWAVETTLRERGRFAGMAVSLIMNSATMECSTVSARGCGPRSVRQSRSRSACQAFVPSYLVPFGSVLIRRLGFAR